MSRARTSTIASGVGALAAVAAVAAAAAPAQAKLFERESFHDSFVSEEYPCKGSDGVVTMAIDAGEVDVHFTAVLRGSSPFPFYREHVGGVVTTTNVDTGGTFTQRFAVNSKDHKITDNGDGTITIVSISAGGTRYYDQDGNFVLKDPGRTFVAFDVDYNGTPGDPSDDTEVPDSFRVVRPSTGNSDFSTRNFCDDLRQFTTP